ncbi:unnamed protein product [Strongylus vulgaris]|uniref:Uncharacterized protein n=1 Tax=Strongylus vulgaris TaxID=40348 RepID=A0A3P7ISG8_STRVU|nr:unnamed protein product [Strongylus vulgaris]
MKSREGTPKRSLKEKEGSPSKKSMRSRTSTPVQESANTLSTAEEPVSDSRRSSKNISKMEVDSATAKRKPEGLPVPPSQTEEKKMRTSSPAPPETPKQQQQQQNQTKRETFKRPPIVLEASRSQHSELLVATLTHGSVGAQGVEQVGALQCSICACGSL